MDSTFLKGLGKEYADPQQRKQYLADNADSVVEKTYMRRFTPEELQSRKEELANVSISINDIENEKKAALDEFKARLKPLAEKRGLLIEDIRKKAETVTGNCYCFVVEEERMTYVINEDGDCIEAPPCTADELQKTVFQPMRLKTGTEN